MIKAKKIGLIIDSKVQVDAILKDKTTVGVTCQFIDCEHDRLYLRFPDDKLQLKQYFYEGREVEISLYTIDGNRSYLGLIIYEPEDGLIVVEYQEITKLKQNRKMLRVKATRTIDLKLNGELVSLHTVDIGGGGCMIVSFQDIPIDTETEAYLRLIPGVPAIKTKIKVLWSKYIPNEEKYYVAISFIEIKEFDCKKIVNFCYDIQLAQLRAKDKVE